MRIATIGLNEAKSVLARVEAEAPVQVKEAVEGFAYSKCDPKKPEIYSPRTDAVERLAEGVGGDHRHGQPSRSPPS